jgi:hypothetical protein
VAPLKCEISWITKETESMALFASPIEAILENSSRIALTHADWLWQTITSACRLGAHSPLGNMMGLYTKKRGSQGFVDCGPAAGVQAD